MRPTSVFGVYQFLIAALRNFHIFKVYVVKGYLAIIITIAKYFPTTTLKNILNKNKQFIVM